MRKEIIKKNELSTFLIEICYEHHCFFGLVRWLFVVFFVVDSNEGNGRFSMLFFCFDFVVWRFVCEFECFQCILLKLNWWGRAFSILINRNMVCPLMISVIEWYVEEVRTDVTNIPRYHNVLVGTIGHCEEIDFDRSKLND